MTWIRSHKIQCTQDLLKQSNSLAPEYPLDRIQASPFYGLVKEILPLLLNERDVYIKSGGKHPAAVLAQLEEPLTNAIFARLGCQLSRIQRIPHAGCADPECRCQWLRYFVLCSRDLGSSIGATKLPPLDTGTIRSRVWRAPDRGVLPLVIATKDTQDYVELPLTAPGSA